MSLAGNTPLFQFLDRWAGGAACAVCETLRVAAAWLPRAGSEGRRGLVFVKLAEQGSTVLAAAAIEDAVERHGRENVHFVVFEENRFILDALELIPPENVIPVRTGGLAQLIASALGALFRVRALRAAELADLELFAKATAAFAFLTGIPKRAGFHSYFGEGPWRGTLFTHRPRYNPHFHTSVTFRSLVAALDHDPAAFPTFAWDPAQAPARAPRRFNATEEERNAMRSLVAAHGGETPGPLILLNANASDLLPLRRWDGASYVALARRLLAEHPGLRVAFTGAPGEAEQARNLVRETGSGRAFCAAGRTTLRELMALYQQADVLVTNDSGPAHFASLTPIYTVVLFGPETPRLFGVESPRAQNLSAGLACSPCVSAFNNRQTSCRNNRCMQGIDVETVAFMVNKALRLRREAA
jgi:ADP-heptose:LPS heptosyltransferase